MSSLAQFFTCLPHLSPSPQAAPGSRRARTMSREVASPPTAGLLEPKGTVPQEQGCREKPVQSVLTAWALARAAGPAGHAGCILWPGWQCHLLDAWKPCPISAPEGPENQTRVPKTGCVLRLPVYRSWPWGGADFRLPCPDWSTRMVGGKRAASHLPLNTAPGGLSLSGSHSTP